MIHICYIIIMNKLIVLIIVFLNYGILIGQDNFSIAIDIQQGTEGIVAFRAMPDGFLVLANSRCFPNYDECYVLAKLGLEGELIWSRRYQNPLGKIKPGTGYGNQGIYIHNDSTFYFGGIQRTYDASQDGFLMKTNETGDSIWVKNYGGIHYDADCSILSQNDGTILVISNLGEGSEWEVSTAWLLAVDLEGNFLWEQFYGTQFPVSLAHDIVLLEDGTMVLLYLSCEDSDNCHYTETNRLRMAKLQSNGEVIWDKSLWKIENVESRSTLLPLNNGDFAVSYYRDNNQGGFFFPPVLIWVDSIGNVMNHHEFPYDRVSWISDMIQNEEGNIVCIGTADLIPEGLVEKAGWVCSFSPEGELLWNHYIKDGRTPHASSVLFAGLEMPDGSLMLGGGIRDSIEGKDDLWLLKLDSNGCFEPGCDDFQVITPTKEIPLLYNHFKIFPNPATKREELTIQNPGAKPGYKYSVIDLLGRLVYMGKLSSVTEQKMPTQAFQRGLYLMQFWDEKGQLMQIEKLIIEE